MKWEESCPLLRPCRFLERVVDSEGFVNVEGPYELWDWTPFVVTFPKQPKTLFPEVELIEGRGRIAYVYPLEHPKAKTRWVSPQRCRWFWPDKPGSS
jgi:hypothetical protein